MRLITMDNFRECLESNRFDYYIILYLIRLRIVENRGCLDIYVAFIFNNDMLETINIDVATNDRYVVSYNHTPYFAFTK